MTKMLKATLRFPDGKEHTLRTYADGAKKPEEIYADMLKGGAVIVESEWIDTLTEHRKKWNEENPDLQIPLDF